MPASAGAADTLGWVYYQKGAYRPAVDKLEAALAREQLQRMLKMYPDSTDATDIDKLLSPLSDVG